MSYNSLKIGDTFVVDNISYHNVVKHPKKMPKCGFAIYVTLHVISYDKWLEGYEVEIIEHCGIYADPEKRLLQRRSILWLKAPFLQHEFRNWQENKDELWRKAGNVGKSNNTW